tara:strand:- start:350 stop:1066 length:717 start_codon:yes stop_codon:yes gene_type:complete
MSRTVNGNKLTDRGATEVDHSQGFDWNDWISSSGVNALISKICAFENNKSHPKAVMETYPFRIRHVPYATDDGTYNRVNRRYRIVEGFGYVNAWTALRDTRVKNFRIHYPDYGGSHTPLNLGFFEKIFKTFPNSTLNQTLTFFVTVDEEIVVDCYIDLSMGISQHGRAGGHLSVKFEKFWAEYEKLRALTLQRRGGREWNKFRVNFERYVSENEHFEMYRWWGKGYEIDPIWDDEVPF